ncbi:MAG: ribose-phosphate diphosphokinase [Gammaproteobacteria bacterium]|nr:ribose-phosphate diphosphokinase [Gammaproteobacteria bacterium]
MQTAIYTFPGYHEEGEEIAETLKISAHEIKVHHFPDKESRVTLPEKKYDHVILFLSLDYPNNKLVELFLTCKSLRQQGTQRISLVAPYLCYMRQDKSFQPGEVISQQVIGQWLSDLLDDIITVDPHLHRIQSLDAVIPETNTIVVSATPLLAEFVKSLNKTVHLIGPDEESLQWVKSVAQISDSPYSVAKKERLSDTHVEIQLPEIDYNNQHVILIDDVISTGHTVSQTADKLYSEGAKQVDVITTHALFSKDAIALLNNAKIKNIWSSNSISHPSNLISLNDLLAQQIRSLL